MVEFNDRIKLYRYKLNLFGTRQVKSFVNQFSYEEFLNIQIVHYFVDLVNAVWSMLSEFRGGTEKGHVYRKYMIIEDKLTHSVYFWVNPFQKRLGCFELVHSFCNGVHYHSTIQNECKFKTVPLY